MAEMRLQPDKLRETAEQLRYLGGDIDHMRWRVEAAVRLLGATSSRPSDVGSYLELASPLVPHTTHPMRFAKRERNCST